MTDTTDDLAHLDARIDLIREQRDAMERIAAERAVASDRNLARWTSATNALHKATADLNATREKLTAAEASRDSLQAEADDAGKMLDAIRSMAGIGASRSEVDTLEVVRLRLECDREITAELRAERNALRGEVDRLRSEVDRAKSDELNRRLTIADDERAEFVLAAVAVAQALDDGRSLGPAGEEQDPRAWVRFARELADRVKASRLDGRATTIAVASEQGSEIAALRAAVLSEQQKVRSWQRSAEQSNEHLAVAENEVAELRARPVLTEEAAIAAIDDIRTALAKLAPATTPSKPADVFAGVSFEELVRISADAYVTAADAPGRAGVAAVLDALRVKLVAPVDPEEFARDYCNCAAEGDEGAPLWRDMGADAKVEQIGAARATLTAKGIPVTPEAGK